MNRTVRRGNHGQKLVWTIILLILTALTAGCEKTAKRRVRTVVQSGGPNIVNLVPIGGPCVVQVPCRPTPILQPEPPPYCPPYWPGLEDPYRPWGRPPPIGIGGEGYPPIASIPVDDDPYGPHRPPPGLLPREPVKPRVSIRPERDPRLPRPERDPRLPRSDRDPRGPRDTESRPPILDRLTPARTPVGTARAEDHPGPVRPPPATLGLLGVGERRSEASPF